jgi:hypothetical protein
MIMFNMPATRLDRINTASRSRARRGTWIVLAVLGLLLAMLPFAAPAHAQLVERAQLAGGGGLDAGRAIAVDATATARSCGPL